MQMQVAQELELFGWKEFAADPSDPVDERGEEQREVAGRSMESGTGRSCAGGMPGRAGGVRQRLGRGVRMSPISRMLRKQDFL